MFEVIAKGIVRILERLNRMSQNIDALVAAAERQTTVDQSIIALLTTLSQQIKDAGVDPVKLAAVVASIEANNQAITDAVTANTTAA